MIKTLLKTIVVALLELEAKLTLKKYKPKIIAVTGSVGKTSTKDAIFAVLEKTLLARKSMKSFNSEIGIPLTILGCENAWLSVVGWASNLLKGFFGLILPAHYPKWLVLEVGADKPGDISRAAKLIAPDIVVFTAFSAVPVHVEFFKTAEALFEEKAQLVKALKPTGVLVVNADDEHALSLRDRTKAKSITYGLNEGAMFRATNMHISVEHGNPAAMAFKFEYEGNVFPVKMHGVLGTQPVYAALAALALGVYLKQNIVEMINALSLHHGPAGRMCVIPGLKGSTIIDDTYNASPIAAQAAVEVLADIKTKGKKIAVLGDMLELGKFTEDEHRKLGAQVGKCADLLLAVGPRAKFIVQGALESDMSEKNIIEFEQARLAGKYLEDVLGEGDVVLVKGSQSMRMERAVEEIMAEPERAGELLVRQEEAWKKR